MKIDEAVDIINGTTTVKAKYNNHSIFVCFKFLPFDGHCFLALRADVKTWDCVTLASGAIDDVIPEDLARVMDTVQRLLDTPVRERFPEKKYTIRTISDSNDSYLIRTAGGNYFFGCLKMRDSYSDQVSFTKDEIEEMKLDDGLAIDWDKATIEEDK